MMATIVFRRAAGVRKIWIAKCPGCGASIGEHYGDLVQVLEIACPSCGEVMIRKIQGEENG